jgi:hypothetical protein
MPVLTVEKPLKQVLGDDGTDSLIRLLNSVQQEQKENILEFVEEKFARRLTEEISGFKERLTDEISGVNGRLTNEIASVRVDMHKIQANIIKWMFIFLVGQFSAIMGSLFLFFK